MVLDEAQQGKASSCACGIEGNWGEGWTNFSPILERICVSKLAISICEKLRIGNVVLRDVLTPSLFQFPLPACANMEATCYCQHAILQRTYSSYQQDEDRWLRWTNVVCFTSGLILIWAQFCRCFTSRHANEKHMSWFLNHWTPPLSIESVQNSKRPAKSSSDHGGPVSSFVVRRRRSSSRSTGASGEWFSTYYLCSDDTKISGRRPAVVLDETSDDGLRAGARSPSSALHMQDARCPYPLSLARWPWASPELWIDLESCRHRQNISGT